MRKSHLLTKSFVIGIESGNLTLQFLESRVNVICIIDQRQLTDLLTVSGIATMTSPCYECLCDPIEAVSLSLPTSAFLRHLLYDEVPLTT